MPEPSNTFALVVGVQDYPAYPFSPAIGARNDVRRWVRLLANHMGLPPKNIVVLANPRYTARDLTQLTGRKFKKRNVGAPRLDRLVAEIGRLGRRVAEQTAEGHDSHAILIWSGHGTSLAGDVEGEAGTTLALCPEDTTRPEDPDCRPENLLTFREIRSLWTQGIVGPGEGASPEPAAPHGDRASYQDEIQNLTMILDTCYSGDETSQGRSINVGPRPDPTVPASRSLNAFGRVMLAAHQGETAKAVRVQHQWYGAFSFALTTLCEQWTVKRKSGVAYLNGSYGDVMFRVREMVQVLGVPNQNPLVSGLRGVEQLAMFNPSSTVYVGSTSASPDVFDPTRQLSGNEDGFTSYELKTDPSGADPETIAIAIVVGETAAPTSPSEYAVFGTANSEFWYWDPTALSSAMSNGVPVKLNVHAKGDWPKSANSTLLNNALALPSGPFETPTAASYSLDTETGQEAWTGQDAEQPPNVFGVKFKLKNSDIIGITWFRRGTSAPTDLLFQGVSDGEDSETVPLGWGDLPDEEGESWYEYTSTETS